MIREMLNCDGTAVPVSDLDQAFSLMRDFAGVIGPIHARIAQGEWNQESASAALELLQRWDHNCEVVKLLKKDATEAAEASRQEMLSALNKVFDQAVSID